MLDFMMVSSRMTKGAIEIYPKFTLMSTTDLMTRGGDFYAIWNEDESLWSTKEEVALYLIDREVDQYAEKIKESNPEERIKVLHMWDAESGMIDRWHKYVQKQRRDNYHPLDEKLIFSNTETTKKDYASKRLSYPLERCNTDSYNELMSVLYSPEERRKIEWAIGAIISGDSKSIQKFLVMYGSAGTGKSTVLNIIQDLFEGYYCVFDSKALGSASNMFALEAFKTNPLVAIQHDGDLSRIEDNTRLNSLVSHEMMTVNEKYKSTYANRFNSFLFMGTNRPVRITDSKSGIIRRLIDVSPTGNKVPPDKYDQLVKHIKFELGGIACHCLDVYHEYESYYENYIPTAMIGASNDFYNFVLDSYDIFKRDDSTTLGVAYAMYKNYCEDARVAYPYPKRAFKEELKSYFEEFYERGIKDGTENERARNLYKGFISSKFENDILEAPAPKPKPKTSELLALECVTSLFDIYCKDCLAQYANEQGTPISKWDNVTSTLGDISTERLHYVKVPENHIVIDFDISDENGNKSFELNAAAAAKWPKTYAELSKSGAGIHLHYIYAGDVTKLSRVYDDNIEIKIFTGGSSLRRKLTKCNDIPIATISSGLPLKEEAKMVNFDTIKNEKALRTLIKKNLLKEYCPGTKPSIDFIDKILNEAYDSGMKYDVSDMASAITTFAARSTHQAEYCLKKVGQMKFKAEELTANFEDYTNDTIIFFDVEVFINLFVVVWKAEGGVCVPMINPTSRDIEELCKYKLVGFNNRDYDNHILMARILGETNEQLFYRSQAIISNQTEAKIGSAYNLSYTDIFDFCSKKQSLKKWEIELGIHHQELGLPWDKPVPEDKFELVAEYCCNDVEATEAVWKARQADFVARQILADLAGGTVNDSTNSLTAKLIFGNNRKPQGVFEYRDLSKPVSENDISIEKMEFLKQWFPEMMSAPHGPNGESILPFFPGYIFNKFAKGDKSTYRGHVAGEGGFVYAKPGMYYNTITFDVASMHPHSVTTEYLFGPYTKIFNELMEARICIKHKDFEAAGKLFNGRLEKYLTDDAQAKALAGALKIAINSIYGLTAQREKNGYCSPFRDIRNVDNIVAKRGALFMIDLLENVTALGGTVVHQKTDSIKLVSPSPELQNYILETGKRYGYTFEVENKFDKICLVNDAVYIAKRALDDEEWLDECKKAAKEGKPEPTRWTATGAEFAVPYIFKSLFSHEPIEFDDLCETRSVNTALYLDFIKEEDEELSADLLKQIDKLKKQIKKTSEQNDLIDKDDILREMNASLEELVAKERYLHVYHFVGKTGMFCPIKAGCGGGILLREKDGGYTSANGSKGYRWLESEMVKSLGKEDCIDRNYYRKLADDAIADISKFGDFYEFAD